MALIYTVHCDDCQVDGPFLRSGVHVVPFTYAAGPNMHGREPGAEAMWHEFLTDHQYHKLSLSGPR